MKKQSLLKSPLRWFLLLWIGMTVAAWLVEELWSGQAPVKPSQPLPLTLLCLLLAALYSFLLWLGLSDQIPPRFLWWYFLVQGLLVFAMQLVGGPPTLTLNFYLALTLCALAMFKRVGPMLLIAMGSLLLFEVSLSMGSPLGGFAGKDLVAAHARIPLDVSFGNNLVGNNLAAAALWFTLWSQSNGMTIVFFVLGYLMVYWQQSHAQTQLERAHRELQAAHHELAASARQIETLTLLAERQRMARELHDTLLQGMAGIIMQLKVLAAQMDRQHYRQAQQALSQTLSSASTALEEARHAIHDLRAQTPRLEQFVASVEEEIAHFFQLTGIACHTRLDDLVHTPPQHCEQVLRVIGEGLSNVARHARARHVSVEAKVMERWLEITVQDDGQGFDPASSELHTGHYGLLGLRERAHLVGGSLSLSSTPGAGTTLRFRVPLAPPDPSALSLTQESSPALGLQEQTYA